MSKAYYYVKNFTFKEVNNLFAYQVKDPSILTKHQRITRLYKGTLRKLMAAHINCTRGKNYERFFEESRKVREDFDNLLENEHDTILYETMVEKYELLIEQLFEPDASLNPSRPYSNLNGKLVLFSDTCLQSDPIGYYKERQVTGKPTGVGFFEEYPDQGNSWVYADYDIDDIHEYKDNETQYKGTQKQI